jgi:hypothetical protein
MTARAALPCAALGCRRPAVVTYDAGPANDPYRIASACRRHRQPIRTWVGDGGRVRRTPITAPTGAAA